MKNDDVEKKNGLLNEEQKKKFEQFTRDAKSLEKEINAMVREFEQKNNVSCWVSSINSNHVIIEISTDIENI
jgi:hypothetical protein